MSRAIKTVHHFAGLLFLLLFAISGQYLKHVFTPEHQNDIAVRMMQRANHIYILLAGLLNLMAAMLGEIEARQRWQKFLLALGSILLLASPHLYGLAFLYEYHGDLNNRRLALTGTEFALGGVGLLWLVWLFNRWQKRLAEQK